MRVDAVTRLFGEFDKIEKRGDGTMYVEGFASTGQRDSDGELVLPSAMRDALPAYMKFGTVREQHDVKKAAGTAVFAEVQEDGRTRFGATLVDPTTILKVEHKVLKGFSIYGNSTRRNKSDRSIIEKLNLTAIDIVDRPADPGAVVDLIKFDSNDDANPGAEDCPMNQEQIEKAIADGIAKAMTAALPGLTDSIAKAMAAKPAKEPEGEIDPDGDVKKAAKPRITLDETAETLAKVRTENADLKKSHDDLSKRFADLEAASKTKGVLKSVDKGDDVTKSATAEPEAKTPFDEIRKVHKAGGEPYFAFNRA